MNVGRIGVGSCLLLVSILVPPEGIGFSICPFYVASEVPCPGCGITRSISSIIRGELFLSLNWHPFGFLLLAYAIIAIVSGMFDRQFGQLLSRIDPTGRGRADLLATLMIAFVTFGCYRAFWVVLNRS